MIAVNRGAAPAFFSSPEHAKLEEEIAIYFRDYDSRKRQRRFDFTQVRRMVEVVRPTLLERFSAKCGYCESTIPDDYAAVDHFRPRSGARGFANAASRQKSAFFEIHYWWLALEWTNLILCCPECNNSKGVWFPLADERTRAEEPGVGGGATIVDEQPLLLDPCTDEPSLHLHYDLRRGYVQALTERGATTIEILALNRARLVTRRQELFHELEALGRLASRKGPLTGELTRAITRFRAGAGRPFLAVQRQFLLENAANLPELWKLLGGHSELAAANSRPSLAAAPVVMPTDLGRIAIERIHVRNFKNIVDLTLEVPQTANRVGGAPWMLFLGENAVGKSSIMQAIVLTLMGDEARRQVAGLQVEDVLHCRREAGRLVLAEAGWVKIWISGREDPLTLSFQLSSGFISNVPTAPSYLVAYGSTRLLPNYSSSERGKIEQLWSAASKAGSLDDSEQRKRVRVQHLFRPAIPLLDAEEWLYQLYEQNRQGFDLVVRGLRDLLLLRAEDTIEADVANPQKRRIIVEFNSRREAAALSHLSDGYRTVLALACDIMSVLVRESTSIEGSEGIVVIDELESNLHPKWKKRLVSSLRKVFPRVQFIVSTHDPLCLRGLFQQEAVLLRRDSEQQVIAVTDLPNPQSLRIDELLTSELFGLSTTVDTDFEVVYDEYYELLLVSRPTKAQRARLADLRQQLQLGQHLGRGLRDELMYEVIDKLIAHERHSPQPRSLPDLKTEVLQQVLQAWEKAGLVTPSS